MNNQGDPSEASQSAAEAFQQKIADGLLEMFDLVISSRRGYYAQAPEKKPSRESIGSIVDSYSRTNAAISGGFNLVPGPWGLVGIAPELTLILRNQLLLIYDIGMAYDQQKALTKELLAAVLLESLGVGAGSLVVMQGSKILVKRVSLRFFQKVIALLSGRVTQQALKSALSKWVPILGAAAMATWVHYTTNKIGRNAAELLSKEIVVEEVEECIDFADPADESPKTDSTPDLQKLRALTCLASIDGSTHAEEAAFIMQMMAETEIPQGEVELLSSALANGKQVDVDYSQLAGKPGEAIGLLIDMVALSSRDGSIHPAERMYIRKTGEILGLTEADLNDLLEQS